MQTLWNFVNTPRNKYQMYLFLNKPRTILAIGYQICIIILIVVCILITMFMSRDEGSPISYIVLFWFDLSVLIVFTFEYVLRVWSSTVLPKYSGKYGYWKVMIHPIYLIDASVIGMTIAIMVFDVHFYTLSAGLRGFRMLQIFENRYRMWRLLWKAIWSEKFQLAVAGYFCIVMLFGIGFLMYFIEQPYNPEFNTVANSVWFAVVTFTTVGYGNSAPTTTAGKIVTGFAMIIGVGLFALPAGIIGASLALKVEEDTSSSSSLRQNYGAALLQNAWKVYWIKEKQRRRRQSQPRVLVRLSSFNKGLQFHGQPTAPSTEIRPYFDANVVQFIFLLKFHLNKRRFRMTAEISDTNNFYETYMQTSWEQTNLILTLTSRFEHLYDSVNASRNDLQSWLAAKQRTRRDVSQESLDSGDDDGNDGGDGGTKRPKSGKQIPAKFAGGRYCCWRCQYRNQRLRQQRRHQQQYELPRMNSVESGSEPSRVDTPM